MLSGACSDIFWARSAQKRERESEPKFCFFCEVNNARLYRFPGSQISRNLHTRLGSVSVSWWILSEANFEDLPARGLFFQKGNFGATVFNDFGLQAAISPKWLQISESHDRLASLRNVGFPFVPLELTQSHSLGLQAAYKKWHSWTSPALPCSAADLMSQSFARRRHKLTFTLHYC